MSDKDGDVTSSRSLEIKDNGPGNHKIYLVYSFIILCITQNTNFLWVMQLQSRVIDTVLYPMVIPVFSLVFLGTRQWGLSYKHK